MKCSLFLPIMGLLLLGCHPSSDLQADDPLQPTPVGESIRVEPQWLPLKPHEVQFHPQDSYRVLLVEDDGSVSVWIKERDEKPIRTLTLRADANTAIFVDEGRSILVGTLGGNLSLWDTSTGQVRWHVPDAHETSMYDLDESPTGGMLLSAGSDDTVRIWDLLGNPLQGPIDTKHEQLKSAEFSPSGDFIATAGDDGWVRFWNLNGTLQATSEEKHEDWVREIAFSPSDDFLASASDDGYIRFWNFDGTPHRPALEDHEFWIYSISFSSSGDQLVSADGAGRIVLRDLAEPDRYKTLQSKGRGWLDTAVSTDGSTVAAIDNAGTVHFWNFDGDVEGRRLGTNDTGVTSLDVLASMALLMTHDLKGQTLVWKIDGSTPTLLGEPLGLSSDATFSPNEDVVVSGGEHGSLQLFDLHSKSHSAIFKGHSEPVKAIRFSRADQLFASAGADDHIILWAADTLSIEKKLIKPIEAVSTRLEFSPSGEILVEGDIDGRLRIWNIQDGQLLRTIEAHDEGIWSITIDAAGQLIASSSFDGTIRIWKRDGSLHGEIPEGLNAWDEAFAGVKFMPTGKMLMTGRTSGEIWLWDADRIALSAILASSGEYPLTNIAVSDSGNLVAGTDINEGIWLWDMTNSIQKYTIEPRPDALPTGFIEKTDARWASFIFDEDHLIIVLPEGSALPAIKDPPAPMVVGVTTSASRSRMAMLTMSQQVAVWNVDEVLSATTVEGGHGWTMALSGGGRLLAYGDNGGRIGIIDVDNDSELMSWKGHSGAVIDLAYSPDRQLLVSTGKDAEARVWRINGSPHLDHSLSGHIGEVTSVAFAPNGDHLASAGKDGTTRLWRRDGDLLTSFVAHNGGVEEVSFSPSGDIILTTGTDNVLRLWSLEGKALASLGPDQWVSVYAAGFLNEHTIWIESYNEVLSFHNATSLTERARLFPGPDGGLITTPDGHYSGQGELVRTALFFDETGRQLSDAEVRELGLYDPVATAAALTGNYAWWRIWASRAQRGVVAAWRWFAEFPLHIQIAILYLAVILSILTLWVVRPATLTRWGMYEGDRGVPLLQGALEILALIRLLGSSPRALRAWLRLNHDQLTYRSFQGKAAVQDRRRYVDLGNDDDVAWWREAVKRGTQAACWIAGAGGCGKSTLAFELCRQTLDELEHPPVPVVIDTDWNGDLLSHVGMLLSIDEARLTLAMIRRMVSRGMLVLVLDGLSERDITQKQRQEVFDLLLSESIRYLVITARDLPDDHVDNPLFRKVEVGPLEPGRLPAFVASYVEEGRVEEVVDVLAEIGRDEPIRPLFARLAIQQLEAGEEVARTYPELVQDYVRALRPRRPGALIEEDFLRAARSAARACTEESLTPRPCEAVYLRAQLAISDPPLLDEHGRALPAPSIVEQLVQCGLLEATIENTVRHVRFTHDPIAEYLMAMHVHTQDGERAILFRQRLMAEPARAPGVHQALLELEQRTDPGIRGRHKPSSLQ